MKKEDLKIVFMGTPEFAVESLKEIIDADFNVAAVITAPDKPAGRGQKLRKSAVKIFAEENKLNILQPNNLKDKDFIDNLLSINADLFIVVAFRMLPEVVWSMPKLGTVNLHASILPQYRGAAPINWAIINGEKETGVTTFFIEKEIDTGKIIFSEKESIDKNETAGSLHDKLMMKGGKLLVKTISAIIEEKVIPKNQYDKESNKTAPKLNKENCKINWNESSEKIYNLIRGLSPYPGSWCILNNNNNNLNVKIFEAEILSEKPDIKPGKIKTDNKLFLKVAALDGFISIAKIQIPGKKPSFVKDFLNGNKLNESTYFS